MKALLEGLERDGFAVLHGLESREHFEALARELGEIVWTTEVQLRSSVRTYLCQPAAVPFHTDHPAADLVAWWCEEQDAVDGASLLVDSREVLAAMNAPEREGLRQVELACPSIEPRASTPATSTWPLLRGAKEIYYAPWLECSSASVAAFRSCLQSAAVASIRLAPNDVLVVDNHRMLHGRGPLGPESRRRLWRLWLRS